MDGTRGLSWEAAGIDLGPDGTAHVHADWERVRLAPFPHRILRTAAPGADA